MRTPRPIIAPALILERQVYDLMSYWGGHTERVECSRTGCLIRVTIIIEPELSIPIVGTIGTPIDPPKRRPPCDVACLSVIDAFGPVTATIIRDKLHEINRRYSINSIRKALQRLVTDKVIVNQTGPPPGYVRVSSTNSA